MWYVDKIIVGDNRIIPLEKNMTSIPCLCWSSKTMQMFKHIWVSIREVGTDRNIEARGSRPDFDRIHDMMWSYKPYGLIFNDSVNGDYWLSVVDEDCIKLLGYVDNVEEIGVSELAIDIASFFDRVHVGFMAEDNLNTFFRFGAMLDGKLVSPLLHVMLHCPGGWVDDNYYMICVGTKFSAYKVNFCDVKSARALCSKAKLMYKDDPITNGSLVMRSVFGLSWG